MKGRIYMDSFSVGLEEMTHRDQRDEAKVLQVLKEKGRFSVFEVNDELAKTMDSIFAGKLARRIGGAYPWTKVEITAEGNALLAAAPLPKEGGES